MNDLTVELVSSQLVVNVEATAMFQVAISNTYSRALTFNVDVIGLNPDWIVVSEPHLYVPAGERQAVTVSITPPGVSGSQAGMHHFAVQIISPQYPGQVIRHEAFLTINPFYDFAVSELLPKRQTISWSKSSARYLISVTNRGNSNAMFRLAGADTEAACRFEFQPPGEPAPLTGQVECLLPPEERAIISVQVSPRATPLAKFYRQRHHFTISVAVPQSGQMGKSVLGALIQKPLIGPGLMLFIAVAVGLWATIVAGPFINYFSTPSLEVTMNKAGSSDQQGLLPSDLPQLPPSPLPPEPDLPLTYEEMFQEIAPQYNLDWRLVEAVAYRESRMDYQAIGRSSDMGLMQIIPATWNEWAPKADVIDPFDPYSNITVGAAYLAFVRAFCAERGYPELQWMLVAYNWGPNRLDRFWADGGTWSDLPRTQRNYAFTILSLAAQRASNPNMFDQIYAKLDE